MSPSQNASSPSKPKAGGPDGGRQKETGVSNATKPTARPGRGQEVTFEALRRYWLVIPLAILVGFFASQNARAFFSPINLQQILDAGAPLLILAVATTFILGSGGIDLSIGSVVVLSGVAAQLFYQANGGTKADIWTVLAGAVIALLVGAVCGAINGVLVAYFHIPALIATLGMTGAALGVAQLLTNGQDITSTPSILVQNIGANRPFGVPLIAYIAVVIAIIAGFFLFRTRFGLRALGIGSDATVLERKGINVKMHTLRVFALAGTIYGVVGILSLARYSTTALNGHNADALNAIAAVVIGGTSLFGGVATMLGSALGVLIPTVLYDGLLIIGLPAYWQGVVIGVVLCGAVYLDQRQRRKRKSR